MCAQHQVHLSHQLRCPFLQDARVPWAAQELQGHGYARGVGPPPAGLPPSVPPIVGLSTANSAQRSFDLELW